MRKMIVALAGVSLLLSGAGLAAPGADQASANRVESHVRFLADDLLEGRDTGSRGHEIAASYVANQFLALGLKPAGEQGGWYQWVPFRRATLVPGKTVLTLGEGSGDTVLPPSEMIARPSLTERMRDFRAGLVFVGYGIDDKALGIDDYAGLDVRGKIVVVLAGAPDKVDNDIAAHLRATKDVIAAQHGAIGIIELGVRPPDPKRPISPERFAAAPLVDWVDANGQSGSEPQGLRVRLMPSAGMAERLFVGAAQSLSQVRKVAGLGNKRVRGFALKPTVAIQSESTWTDFKSPEVVAMLPGTDPALKGEYVAMMGHLDHLGIKKDAKPGEDNIYNGALDNAAGVATLIEAARQFVDSGEAPKRSILFVVHTGEEKGLLGADYFAAHPTVPIKSIVGGVDLDMPVPLYPFNDVVAFGGGHSTVRDAIAKAAAEMGMSVSPDPMPEQSIFTRSDHYQFVRRGVPAVLLFTGYGNGGKAKWDDFFANRYHSVKDDVSQPILWDAAARYAQLNYRIVRQLADAPQRPMWIKGNYFGDLFDPKGPRAPAEMAH
ncbi:M20/M25/M40 family metallo-hydrolase [Sphingomonas jaspsi]|uniref:M20/M25/M40 family metallo-hydrolase n=1 Tax=Sphingomonas jaspsi TaxID=392409 RepID=UPI000564B458|nr:M20/M25/M40 family metallo-hydrolase [Sphingomonas jaspsi]